MAIVSTRPGIKVKMGIRFPAKISVTSPLTLTVNGNEYIIGIDATTFPTTQVWMWQLKKALNYYGQLYTVDAAIPADVTQEMNILWNGSGARSSLGDDVSDFIKSTLSWSDGQMSSLYTTAAVQVMG